MTAPINVKIKLEDGGILPTKGTPGSAAYDVYLPCDYTIKEGRQMLPLNFRMEMPDGYEAMIEPRSVSHQKVWRAIYAYGTTPRPVSSCLPAMGVMTAM